MDPSQLQNDAMNQLPSIPSQNMPIYNDRWAQEAHEGTLGHTQQGYSADRDTRIHSDALSAPQWTAQQAVPKYSQLPQQTRSGVSKEMDVSSDTFSTSAGHTNSAFIPSSSTLPSPPNATYSNGASIQASTQYNNNHMLPSSVQQTNYPVSTVIDSLRNARLHYNEGRYTQTVQLCKEIRQYAPDRTDNLLLLGAAHFQLRNYRECIEANQSAIRLHPNFAEAYGNLGNALKEIGDVKGAIEFYVKAIEIQPKFVDAYNNLAAAYMQQGQSAQAIETYNVTLRLSPHLVDAWSNLGTLFKSAGRLDDAMRCYHTAIEVKPDFAIAWGNLAGVHKDKGDLRTAMQYYKEAIRLDPMFVDAYSNLGNVQKESGLLAEAKNSYGKAIEIRPDLATAYGNLASVYYDEGNMLKATEMYQKALELEPNFPDVYNNLGNAYREIGRLDDSITCYRTALQLKPDHPHAYNNLGNSLKDKGMIKDSIECYSTAIRLMPNFAAAHSNLASILKEQGRIDDAIVHYRQALQIDPHFADAYSNLGNAYKDQGRLADAILCYSTAIRLKPGFADAYSNLASAYKDGGRIPEAIVCYRKALELKPTFPDAFSNLVHSLVLVCDWRTRGEDFEKLAEMLSKQITLALPLNEEDHQIDDVHSSAPSPIPPLPAVQPFHSLVYPMSLAQMQRLAKAYARRAALNMEMLGNEKPRFVFAEPQLLRPPKHRLRVGYVSSDFGNHPLSHLMQSVFGMHDTSNMEIFCYALLPDDNTKWRKKIMSEMEPNHFVDISTLIHTDAARRIASDGIHILVNLNGYTKGARNEIFALRPAPIQVSYMGFCGTMGADYIDYFVVDKSVVPNSLRQFYTEKLVYMPHCYFVNDHRQSSRHVLQTHDTPSRDKYGIPKDKFVFANFNQIYKIDPRTFRTWMKILRRVPNSILWLLRFPASGEANIRMAAQAFGIDDSRIHFTDVASKEEHLRRGVLVDLFLDTPVCNAHTTGCDILWAGVPMVTLPGRKMASRVAASLLNAAGLQECIASSLIEYEDIAVALATEDDGQRLMKLRTRFETERHTCPLFDTPRWVRNLERGYEEMWSLYASGLSPQDIEIKDCLDETTPEPVTIISDDVIIPPGQHDEAQATVSEYSQHNPPGSEPLLSDVIATGTPTLGAGATPGPMPNPVAPIGTPSALQSGIGTLQPTPYGPAAMNQMAAGMFNPYPRYPMSAMGVVPLHSAMNTPLAQLNAPMNPPMNVSVNQSNVNGHANVPAISPQANVPAASTRNYVSHVYDTGPTQPSSAMQAHVWQPTHTETPHAHIHNNPRDAHGANGLSNGFMTANGYVHPQLALSAADITPAQLHPANNGYYIPNMVGSFNDYARLQPLYQQHADANPGVYWPHQHAFTYGTTTISSSASRAAYLQ